MRPVRPARARRGYAGRRRGRTPGYAEVVSSVDGPSAPYRHGDDDRVVDVSDDGFVVLPEQSVDDTDRGWGEWSRTNDDRLREDRPPHWD